MCLYPPSVKPVVVEELVVTGSVWLSSPALHAGVTWAREVTQLSLGGGVETPQDTERFHRWIPCRLTSDLSSRGGGGGCQCQSWGVRFSSSRVNPITQRLWRWQVWLVKGLAARPGAQLQWVTPQGGERMSWSLTNVQICCMKEAAYVKWLIRHILSPVTPLLPPGHLNPLISCLTPLRLPPSAPPPSDHLQWLWCVPPLRCQSSAICFNCTDLPCAPHLTAANIQPGPGIRRLCSSPIKSPRSGLTRNLTPFPHISHAACPFDA